MNGVRFASASAARGRRPASRSLRDTFDTLTVPLGLSQCPMNIGGHFPGVKRTYQGCCGKLRSESTPIYMIGMALCGREPGSALRRQDRCRSTRGGFGETPALRRSTAHDIGIRLSGTTAMARRDGGRRRRTVEILARHLKRHYQDPGNHIFYNQGARYRMGGHSRK
jgi:hypothetical protein